MKTLIIRINIILVLNFLFSVVRAEEYSIGNIKIEADKEIIYDVEKGIISAKDGIVIRNENLKIYGKRMTFYVKDKVAEIEGEPIKIEGSEFYMEIEKVNISFLKENLISSGEISVQYGNNNLKCNKIFYDLKNDKGIAENDVILLHSFPSEQKFKIAGGENESIEIKTDKVKLFSDKIEIDRKKNWALATGNPKLEIEEGYLTSKELECDFSKKEIIGRESIFISIKDIMINGEKLKLNYENKIAIVENATCKYKENFMQGNLIELFYSDDKHLINIKGQSTFVINVEEKNK